MAIVGKNALEKMKIKPGEGSSAAEMIVTVNPESYQMNYTHSSGEKSSRRILLANGEIKTERVVEFESTLSFDLWFDNTGGIPNSKDVRAQIADLKQLLVEYQGDIHAVPLVDVIWGNGLSYTGQCTGLNISFTHFSRGGTPLRAKATVSLSTPPDIENSNKQKKPSSPDLTHSRIVQSGDTLPLMCYRIYKDPRFYPQVARANGLSNFTSIKPGQRIFFPPLED